MFKFEFQKNTSILKARFESVVGEGFGSMWFADALTHVVLRLGSNELSVVVSFFTISFLPAGKLRYANNSNYKNDVMIRKEVTLR